MNSNHQPHDEAHDARLTAFALGELRGEELAEVSRLVDANPDARRIVEEIRELAAALALPGARAAHAPREVVHHAEHDGCVVTGKKRSLLRAIETELVKEAPPMHATQPTVRPKKRDYRRIAAWSVVATTACVLAVCLILPAVRSPQRPSQLAATSEAVSKHAAKVGFDKDDERKTARDAKSAGEKAAPRTLEELLVPSDSMSSNPNAMATEPLDAPLSNGAGFSLGPANPAARPGSSPDAPRPSDPAGRANRVERPQMPPQGPVPSALPSTSSTDMKNPPLAFSYGNTGSPAKKPQVTGLETERSKLNRDRAAISMDTTFDVRSTDPRMQPYEEREPVNNGALTLGTAQYEQLAENRFKAAEKHPLSTFAIDVDTASYANIRRFLMQGQLPPPAAVRIEEMINYFRYDYSPPTGRTPFAVQLEAAECPWNGNHRLVRIGLKGKEIDAKERGPSNLVFLLDVSGSMAPQERLPLVKQAMSMLVDQLTEDDRVAIVTYAGDAGVRLQSTNGTEKSKIRGAIESLYAGGSTHGSAGLQQAYEQAKLNFVRGGVNRVIWATDGDLNVGVTGDDELVKLITEKAKTGVFLTVLGVGTDNLKDAKLEKMADKGNGVYAYLDSVREAQKVLVEQMTGSLVTIAKDVKIQVEFNPAEVQAYRLVGYENRVMANKDFRDDKKDAGEIGAGHTVTALYEVVPVGAKATNHDGEPLKYQQTKPARELSDAAKSGELLTVRLRYKEPDGEEATEIEFALTDSEKRFGAASADFRFAAAVASFGLILRNSEFRGGLTLAAVEEFAAGATGNDPGGYRAEFVSLVKRARLLSGK